MEQRILPPELENRRKLTPRRQTLLAAAFVTVILAFVVFVIWLRS